MPKRIYIKDGGLTASSPVPSGFTLLGSESGEVKKQVDVTISSLGGGGSLPYKVYSALLTQTDTNAPTATILQNTLGVTPTYTYYGFGVYSIDSASTFVLDKTVAFGQNPTNQNLRFDTVYDAPNKIYIYSGANDVLNKNFIEIRVYD